MRCCRMRHTTAFRDPIDLGLTSVTEQPDPLQWLNHNCHVSGRARYTDVCYRETHTQMIVFELQHIILIDGHLGIEFVRLWCDI